MTAFSDGPGRGSELVVRLPAPVEEVERTRPGEVPERLRPAERSGEWIGLYEPLEEPAPIDSLGPARRILIVDDNQDSADSLGMVLGLLGNEVRIAYNGTDGLATAESFRPELILLDIGMPGMSGHEVARRLRRTPAGESVVLIALTGFGTKEDRRRSQEAGFNAHLVKPLDLDALREVLESPELEKNGWVA